MAEQSQINKVNIFYICQVVFYVVFSFLKKNKIKKRILGYMMGCNVLFWVFFFFFMY